MSSMILLMYITEQYISLAEQYISTCPSLSLALLSSPKYSVLLNNTEQHS